MRHLKTMGATAIAVFALVAFGGPATASATRLCKVSTSPCPSASTYFANFIMMTDLAPGTNAVLTTSGSPVGVNPTFTCSSSGVNIQTSNTGGGAGVSVTVAIPTLGLPPSFEGCTSTNPSGCSTSGTVVNSSLPGATGTIAWTSGANGTLQLQPPLVTFTCPILGATVKCAFGGSGTVDATITGATTAVIDVVNQSIASTGGFGCPTASQWNARYSSTSPPVFISNS